MLYFLIASEPLQNQYILSYKGNIGIVIFFFPFFWGGVRSKSKYLLVGSRVLFEAEDPCHQSACCGQSVAMGSSSHGPWSGAVPVQWVTKRCRSG